MRTRGQKMETGGVDADGTVPCGLSGNPIRLGAGIDNLRSCFGGADWIQWGVMGHELAHNFLSQSSFADFVSGLSNPASYTEGLATALSAFSLEEIITHAPKYGLSANTLASLHGLYLPGVPDNLRHIHYLALTNYEANPGYELYWSTNLSVTNWTLLTGATNHYLELPPLVREKFFRLHKP